MGSAVITPSAPAPAAAPSTPAPAAAPSSPAPSTPAAAPQTSSPAAAQPSSPSEPVSMGERLAKGWEAAKAAVAADAGEEAVLEAPAADVPAAEPGAEAPVEAAPEAPAAESPAVEQPVAPAEEEFQFQLEDTGEAGDPAAFFNEVKKDPATEKFFNDHPELKNQVAGALRRDKENREIRSYAPTVEAAKAMSQGASLFQTFDNSFLKATTAEGAQEFLNHWVREAMMVDDKGQPVMDADGKYKLHPSLPYIFDHIAGNKVSVWAGQVKQTGRLPEQLAPLVASLRDFAVSKGDDRLQAAADIIKEAISPSSSAQGEVPAELKPYADSLKAKEDALNQRESDAARQQREAEQSAHVQSIERAETKAADSVKAQLKPRFANSGLTEFEQQSALREIGEALDAKFGLRRRDGSWNEGTHPSSRMFQSIYESILLNHPPGEAREKALTKHLLTFSNEVLGPITAAVIREAKKGALERQPDKQAKVAAQTATSQSEPRGTSVTTSPAKQMSPAQLREQVIKDYKAQHNGDEPERDYVMREQARRLGLFGLK